MNWEEKLKIFKMSLEEKILEVFLEYPNKINYIQELVEDIQDEFASLTCHRGKQLHADWHKPMSLYFYVPRIGELRKNIEFEDGKAPYSIDFTPFEESLEDRFDLEDLQDEDVNRVVQLMLPFLISGGEDIQGIPLLINTFPEFTRFALRWKNND